MLSRDCPIGRFFELGGLLKIGVAILAFFKAGLYPFGNYGT